MEKMDREHIAEIIDAMENESVDGEVIEHAASKAAKKLYMKRIRKHGNRIVVVGLCLAMIVAGVMIATTKMSASNAYAITADGEDICYVKSKSAADKVINELVSKYTPEDAEVKAVGNDTVKAVPADADKVEAAEISKVDEAVELVDSALQTKTEEAEAAAEETSDVEIVETSAASADGTDADSENTSGSDAEGESESVAGIQVISVQTVEETFTPEVTYEKDESMFAGESEIKTEGKDGKRSVTKLVTTLNGNVTDENVLESETIEEGTSEVIVKGTLGLPEGEDWQTYEGDPVFNNADDLITVCKKYIGAPYKYGGESLTNGIDCVAYVRQMYARFGISLPKSHSGLQSVGTAVSKSNIQKGDLVCYSGHVAIYIGNGKVINATRAKGVAISNLNMNKKLITIRRIPHN